MKLRLKGNSIRLRLTQREVEQLASSGIVEEAIQFGPGKRSFTYAIEVSRDIVAVGAEYENERMRVLLPSSRTQSWASSGEVGIEASDGLLRIVVEKDFACLKPRPGEDELGMFPNPGTAQC
jgi:hypothetical protein